VRNDTPCIPTYTLSIATITGPSCIRRTFASVQRIASFHQLLSPRSLPETSTGETSDSRFSDELQQGRLNMDVVFTTDVDDVHDDQTLETGKADVSCLETMENQ